MRSFLYNLIVIGLLVAGVSVTEAQVFGLDNHTVTIQVLPFTSVQVIGGGVILDMSKADVVAGQDLMTIADQSSSISWATNAAGRKITIATNLAAPTFSLKAVALGPSRGTPAPEAVVTITGRDFLLNIGRSTGTATLRYTGIASASQGTGTDNHLVTFTIQSQ